MQETKIRAGNKLFEKEESMPRNVRNFWIETEIDGASKSLEGGPKKKEGGFTTNVFMREKGGVKRVLEITGYIESGTSNNVLVIECVNKERIEIKTQR